MNSKITSYQGLVLPVMFQLKTTCYHIHGQLGEASCTRWHSLVCCRSTAIQRHRLLDGDLRWRDGDPWRPR